MPVIAPMISFKGLRTNLNKEIYVPQGERLQEQWPGSAAALLLRPAADARGYEAPLFDAELAECKFVEYPIDTWSKATLAIAPLFSASWEAAASQAASQDFGGGLGGTSMQMTQVRDMQPAAFAACIETLNQRLCTKTTC